MITPSSRCTVFYKHYKVTVVAETVGSVVTTTTYTYDPLVSSTDPVLSTTAEYPSFDNMEDFEDYIQEVIKQAYPWIDSRVEYEYSDALPVSGVDLPDPIEQDVYDESWRRNGNVGSSGSAGGGVAPRPVVTGGGTTVTGKEISGAPVNPQVTHPNPRSSASQTMKAQRPRDTNNHKKHRKGLGRNETVADVLNLMSRAIDTIDAKRIKFIDPQSGSWANESRNNALERLVGLKTSQVPLSDLLSGKDVTFVRYAHELIHNKGSSAVIEGKGLVGKELALKHGEEFAKYIDILDGDNIAAIQAFGMSQKTGKTFVPNTLSQNIGVGELSQESVSGAKKKSFTSSPNAFGDTQQNQVSFVGIPVPPLVFNELYAPKLGGTYRATVGPLDYQAQMFGELADNNAAKSVLTLTPSAAEMELADIYFAIANAGNFDNATNKMRMQDRLANYYVKQQAGGSYFDLLINGKGLESDPNTVTLRRLAASFAAVLLCIRGVCSECRHYMGSGGENVREITADGSVTLTAALSCEKGYTDAGGVAKGPESLCGVDETSANSSTTGIQFELNDAISDKIREARNAIEKDGSEAYLALKEQYGDSAPLKSTSADVAAAVSDSTMQIAISPSSFQPTGQDPSS